MNKWIFVFFASFFLLLCNGRLANLDTGEQYKQALNLVHTGHYGTSNASAVENYWVRAPNGLYYEPHDLGNITLLIPGALISKVLGHQTDDAWLTDTPLPGKVITSVFYALISAFACLFIYLFLAEFQPRGFAFLASCGFAAATYFPAYAKSGFDVLPTAAGVAALLYFTARLIRQPELKRNGLYVGLALGVTCLFRYSLSPFLVIGLLSIAVLARIRLTSVLTAVIVYGLMLVPTFVWNYIRMGSIFRPGTAAPMYLNGTNSMHGDIVHGLYGLTLGVARGVFEFSPLIIPLLLLPFAWRKLAKPLRIQLFSWSLGAILYLLMISKMDNWGAFGWGPRYLLPIFPILFVLSATAMGVWWRVSRLPIQILVAVCCVFSLPPMLVNWPIVVATYPRADDQNATWPAEIEGAWVAMADGLQGEDTGFVRNATPDPARAFPDILTAQMIRHSKAGAMVGMLAVLIGLTVFIVSLLRVRTGLRIMREKDGNGNIASGSGDGMNGPATC